MLEPDADLDEDRAKALQDEGRSRVELVVAGTKNIRGPAMSNVPTTTYSPSIAFQGDSCERAGCFRASSMATLHSDNYAHTQIHGKEEATTFCSPSLGFVGAEDLRLSLGTEPMCPYSRAPGPGNNFAIAIDSRTHATLVDTYNVGGMTFRNEQTILTLPTTQRGR